MDKRRMDELRVEVGVKGRVKTLVRSRLNQSYSGKMGEENPAKRSDAQKVEGKRRQGRPRIRWEDWVNMGLDRLGEGGGTTQQIGVGDS